MLAVERLAGAGRAAARIGGTVLLEPLSAAPRYPLRTAADALAVVDRVAAATGVRALGLLLDLYHLAVNGEDLDRAVAVHGPRAAHVQIADAPGRGAPGTGQLDLARHLRRLEDGGYAGVVALEHLPGDGDPFAWLPRSARAAG